MARDGSPEVGDREQMEDAAFWQVYTERGWTYQPIDQAAVYGYVSSTDKSVTEYDISVREGLDNLVTAIRCVGGRHDLKHHPNDRVRLNDKTWMEVVQPEEGLWADEGFLARFENGDVVFEVVPHHVPERSNVESGPRVFRYDTGESYGRVSAIEVEWGDVDE